MLGEGGQMMLYGWVRRLDQCKHTKITVVVKYTKNALNVCITCEYSVNPFQPPPLLAAIGIA
jgi:hypothetical protein